MLFFTANDGVHGRELWKSAGTAAGTVLLKDITLGDNKDGPGWLTPFGDTLIFTADEKGYDSSVWKTDGTEAGTTLLKDIPSGSYPESYTVVGDTAYFSVLLDNFGYALWKTDGTEAGTVQVKRMSMDIYNDGRARQLINFNGALFFAGDDAVHGEELWKSDGTEAGTVLVKDINTTSATASSYPYMLAVVGDKLFFVAEDGVHGRELWVSDGTPAGTKLVKDLVSGPDDGIDHNAFGWPGAVGAGGVLFLAPKEWDNDWLYRSDGTSAGTQRFDLKRPIGLLAVGDIVYTAADTDPTGWELWKIAVVELSQRLHVPFVTVGSPPR